MRDRFDFCSIAKILLENRTAGNLSGVEYFRRIFDYAFSQEKIIIPEPIETDIRKIVKGQLPIPKKIVDFYQDDQHFSYLKEDVSYLLADIFDLPLTVKRLCDLLMEDDTISWEKRQAIAAQKEDTAQFLAECIRAGTLRRADTKSKGDAKDHIVLSDYLENYRYPKGSKVFFGRDTEVLAIHERLKEESCLFLQGIGGIGKSELAKYYGSAYKKEYDHVLYLYYEEDLYQTICQLSFIDDTPDMSERDLFESHYRLFHRLGEHTLVILDNFNQLPEEDELLQEFASLSFRLLVTTSSMTDDFPCYPVKEIASMEALQKIFFSYIPEEKQKPDIACAIIEEVYRHTLTVEMAAKTMKATDLEPEELLEALKNDHLYISSPNKVRIQKDERIKTATPKEHLARLFQLQHLSNQNQVILQHLRLMPASGIPKRLFGKWMLLEDFNGINKLIDYGWIQEDEHTNRLSIHPFLHGVLGIFGVPSLKKCQSFIRELREAYKSDDVLYSDLLSMSKSIFKTLDIDDNNLGFCLFEVILDYLEKHLYYRTMSDVLDRMKEILTFDTEHGRKGAIYEYHRGQVAWWYANTDICVKHFLSGISLLTPADSSNFKLVIEMQSHLSMCYLSAFKFDEYLECTKTIVNLRKEFGSAELLEDEFERLNLRLATAMKECEAGNFDLDALFETTEFQDFSQKTRELCTQTVSKNEVLADFEKIVPEEMPDELSFLFQGLKEEVQLSMSEKQEELSIPEFFGDIIVSAVKLSDKYQEEIKRLKP